MAHAQLCPQHYPKHSNSLLQQVQLESGEILTHGSSLPGSMDTSTHRDMNKIQSSPQSSRWEQTDSRLEKWGDVMQEPSEERLEPGLVAGVSCKRLWCPVQVCVPDESGQAMRAPRCSCSCGICACHGLGTGDAPAADGEGQGQWDFLPCVPYLSFAAAASEELRVRKRRK